MKIDSQNALFYRNIGQPKKQFNGDFNNKVGVPLPASRKSINGGLNKAGMGGKFLKINKRPPVY